jgi:hypothetical protein
LSLDTAQIRRLTGKEFDKLYTKSPDKWTAMVNKALEYAQTCVGKKEAVRPGDVVAVVQNAIRIDPSFERHLADKKLTQNYWLGWFAEYIVEKAFPQPDLSHPAP